jgi:hypothetical protein
MGGWVDGWMLLLFAVPDCQLPITDDQLAMTSPNLWRFQKSTADEIGEVDTQ